MDYPASAAGHISSRAQRETAARAVLAEAPPLDPVPAGAVRSIAGEVLHASRSRPVVKWTISERSSDAVRRRVIVGKVYGRGGGAAAHELLRRLHGSGFDGAFAVPTPLDYLPARQLLLQSEAPRATLHDGLDDLAASLPDVRRTGAWLARLHAVTRTGLAPLDPSFEADKATEYVSRLAFARPDLATPFGVLHQRLLERLSTEPFGSLVPTHGDFQPKNVHLDADRVVVIDFDRAALAPAARDLGHFVGQALTMAAAHRGGFDDEARGWTAAFLGGYLAAGGSVDALRATPPYVARTFLEVLFYRLVVRPETRRSFAQQWLDECLAWLDRESLRAA